MKFSLLFPGLLLFGGMWIASAIAKIPVRLRQAAVSADGETYEQLPHTLNEPAHVGEDAESPQEHVEPLAGVEEDLVTDETIGGIPGSYSVGQSNTNSCPAGSTPLLTRQSCKDAALHSNFTWSGELKGNRFMRRKKPKACIVKGDEVTWNPDPTGASKRGFKPICLQDMVMQGYKTFSLLDCSGRSHGAAAQSRERALLDGMTFLEGDSNTPGFTVGWEEGNSTDILNKTNLEQRERYIAAKHRAANMCMGADFCGGFQMSWSRLYGRKSRMPIANSLERNMGRSLKVTFLGPQVGLQITKCRKKERMQCPGYSSATPWSSRHHTNSQIFDPEATKRINDDCFPTVFVKPVYRSMCLVDKFCLNQMDLHLISNDQWICSCLWENMLHDPICKSWNICIAEKEAEYHDDILAMADLAAAISSYNGSVDMGTMALVQSRELDPPRCIDPLTVDVFALTCDCLSNIRKSCAFPASGNFSAQAESIECLRMELCKHGSVCPSWKGVRCTPEERAPGEATGGNLGNMISGVMLNDTTREDVMPASAVATGYTENANILAAITRSGLPSYAIHTKMRMHQQFKEKGELDSSLGAKCGA